MKLSLPISILLSFLTLGLFSACTSNDESEVWIELTYNNLSVTSFSLESNDKVLAHLDSVFFSIDLDNARIFNADSLPKGTDIHALLVSIGLPTVSRAMLYFEGKEGRDSVNYLEDTKDSIDFSRGPAILSITTADGLMSRNYSINVLVHNEDPDSLAWGSTAMRTLPSSLAAPVRSRTVSAGGKYYCLTTDGQKACLSTASDIEGAWTDREITLPEGASVNSLTASATGLYILDSANRLHISTDEGATWTATPASMSHIYGAYGDEIIGCMARPDGTSVQISYPSSTDIATATALPDGCPVEGTSNLMVFTTEWSESAMAIMTGGRDASGNLSGASWAYDGTRWMNISIVAGEPRSGMSVIPYIGYRSDSYWVSGTYEVFLAFGGTTADGKVSNEVWISFDRGLHWTQGRQSIQLPDFIPAVYGASTLVADQTLTSSSPSRSLIWKDYPDAPLPSRASIDSSWTCPFIYIIGGYNDAGSLSNSIWRGAINRLTYRPLF